MLERSLNSGNMRRARTRTHQDTCTTGRNDIIERGPTAQIRCNYIAYPRCQHFVLPLPYLKFLKRRTPGTAGSLHASPMHLACTPQTPLVVPVLRSCQSPMWIWLVNYLHLHYIYHLQQLRYAESLYWEDRHHEDLVPRCQRQTQGQLVRCM